MNDLSPARSKLDRGIRHIEEFQAVETSFMATEPIAITIAYHPAYCRRIIEVEQQHKTPDDLFLCAGDAIHNLRTALDIAAYAILAGTDAKKSAIAFPIGKDSDDFPNAMARCQFSHAPDNVRDALIQLQPWSGSASWLSTLHQLDIQDKHKLPLTFAMTANLSGEDFTTLIGRPPAEMRVRLQVGVRIRNGPPDTATEDEKQAFRRQQREGVHRAPVRPQFATFFDGDGMARSFSCVAALTAMAKAVQHALSLLDRSMSSNKP